jgi:hypothetical protein
VPRQLQTAPDALERWGPGSESRALRRGGCFDGPYVGLNWGPSALGHMTSRPVGSSARRDVRWRSMRPSGGGPSREGDQAPQEAARFLGASSGLFPGQRVPRDGLGSDRRSRVLLAGVPHRGLGHRRGHERVGCLPQRRVRRRADPPGDGTPPRPEMTSSLVTRARTPRADSCDRVHAGLRRSALGASTEDADDGGEHVWRDGRDAERSGRARPGRRGRSWQPTHS